MTKVKHLNRNSVNIYSLWAKPYKTEEKMTSWQFVWGGRF